MDTLGNAFHDAGDQHVKRASTESGTEPKVLVEFHKDKDSGEEKDGQGNKRNGNSKPEVLMARPNTQATGSQPV